MFPSLKFSVENDKLSVKGLPEHLQLRGIKPGSKTLAELKHLSIASANIAAAKFYMDAIKTATAETDAHMFDAALLAAIVKYGSVFKPDSKGRTIDPSKIFTSKILIVNKSVSEQEQRKRTLFPGRRINVGHGERRKSPKARQASKRVERDRKKLGLEIGKRWFASCAVQRRAMVEGAMSLLAALPMPLRHFFA